MLDNVPPILFFAASTDQRAYFTTLHERLHLATTVHFYQSSRAVSFNIAPKKEALHLWLAYEQRRNPRRARWAIYAQARLLFAQAVAVLERYPAHVIALWNGKKFRQAMMAMAAKQLGRQCLFFETGPLPSFGAIDPKGVDAWSSVPRDAAFYRKRAAHNPTPEHCATAKDTPTKPAGLPERYTFIPLQVLRDSNIYVHSPWLTDMQALIAEISALAAQCPEDAFIIKPHPEDAMTKPILPTNVHWVESAASTTLVAHAARVITINSTVGMEALMAGKPIIVLGDAIYGIEGLVQRARNRAELLAAYQTPFKTDNALIATYLDYLVKEYAVPGNMHHITDEHIRTTEAKICALLMPAAGHTNANDNRNG